MFDFHVFNKVLYMIDGTFHRAEQNSKMSKTLLFEALLKACQPVQALHVSKSKREKTLFPKSKLVSKVNPYKLDQVNNI